MKRCNHCGTHIYYPDNYCEKCGGEGTDLPDCLCGKSLSKNQFCSKCGLSRQEATDPKNLARFNKMLKKLRVISGSATAILLLVAVITPGFKGIMWSATSVIATIGTLIAAVIMGTGKDIVLDKVKDQIREK